MYLWLLWALSALLGLLLFLLLRRAALSSKARLTGLFLAFGAWLFPLGRWLLERFIIWAYTNAPDAWARRWMPSRGHLPLKHYLHKADQLLARGLWAWTGLLLLALLFLILSRREVRHAVASWLRKPFAWAPLSGALLAVVLFFGYNLWLDLEFRQPHPVFYTDCHKVWGHRGHPEPPEIIENTIPSFQRAFDLGAPGVEMDVRYDAERHEYYIGRYDRGPDVPPDQRLTLEQIFTAVGDRGYFWLDTKTIHYMTPEEAQQAAQDMAQLLDRFGLRQRAIIESDTPENLVYFARAGLHTSYWIFNIDETAFPKTPWGLWWTLVRIKQNYIRGGFSAISLDVRFYTPLVRWMLKGARIHLFTIDDPEALRYWASHDEVRVILTDTARYDITTCP